MSKFKKPPLTAQEKEKKAEEFLNFTKEGAPYNNKASEQNTGKAAPKKEKIAPKKEKTQILLLRIPESFKKDLEEISNLTGISMNAVCLELLRATMRKKLKELREENNL